MQSHSSRVAICFDYSSVGCPSLHWSSLVESFDFKVWLDYTALGRFQIVPMLLPLRVRVTCKLAFDLSFNSAWLKVPLHLCASEVYALLQYVVGHRRYDCLSHVYTSSWWARCVRKSILYFCSCRYMCPCCSARPSRNQPQQLAHVNLKPAAFAILCGLALVLFSLSLSLFLPRCLGAVLLSARRLCNVCKVYTSNL